MFRYRYCKARMAAYLNGELPIDVQRRVGRYIDQCDACYQEYTRQRALQRELQATLPALGTPGDERLSRMWAGIQQNLHSPPRQRQSAFQLRYGLATLLMLVLVFSTLLISGPSVSPVTATLATPVRDFALVANATQTATDNTPREGPIVATGTEHPIYLTDLVDVTDVAPVAARTPATDN
jgi:anti-sigma factor RsiW